MGIKHKAVNLQEDPSPRNFFNHLPKITTANLPSAAASNEGGIVYDDTANVVKFSDGSSWAAVGAAAGTTLQAAYTNGAEVTGASSSGAAVLVGDGTKKVAVYSDGTNGTVSSVAAPLKVTSAASQDLLISCGTTKDIKINVGTADQGVIIGGSTSTDFTLTGAASTAVWDASANNLTVSSGGYLKCTGSGTGKGLVIPSHATASPNAQDAAGNIFFEIDAKKLWVYDGTTWVGTTLA